MGLTDILKSLFEALKLRPRHFVAAGLITACLLFLPSDLLERVGVAKLAEDYRAAIGLVLVASLILFTVSVAADLCEWIKQAWAIRRYKREVIKRLERLTEDEKQILRFYLAKQTRTNMLRVEDGIVQGLVSAGIIYQAHIHGSLLNGFAHNITEVAWNHLNEQPGLLNGTTNTYRTDFRHELF